jgi:putative membrane protein
MVTDHTAANTELTQLAAGKKVTLPTALDAKHQAMVDKLSKLTGADFDREYMKMMVNDHEKAVKMFQDQSQKGTDADAKSFAAKTLPTLQSHLQLARTVSATVGGGKSGGNKTNTNSGEMNMNSNMGMNTNSNRSTNSNKRSNSNSNSNRGSNSNTNSNSNSNRL